MHLRYCKVLQYLLTLHLTNQLFVLSHHSYMARGIVLKTLIKNKMV